MALVEHLNKQESCKKCYHRAACEAWVRNATTLYDDYDYSVENCPYYVDTADVQEVRYGELKGIHRFGGNCWLGYCSACGIELRGYSEIDVMAKHKYCHGCGVKLIGWYINKQEKYRSSYGAKMSLKESE